MLLKNCRILDGGMEKVVDILIDNFKIKNIGQDFSYDGKIIDLEGKYVLPGLIDPHVHFRDPGMTQKEDFYTGSKAAAAGGVTTFLDMPNTVPPTTTKKLLNEKRELAKRSVVDFGFHFGAAIDNLLEIKYADNIASTKVFLNVSTGKLMIDDDGMLDKIFSNSKIITVHAEDEQVKRSINFAKRNNSRLYLCHISQKSELDMIKQSLYERLYVEVTPHHLFLTEKDKSYLNMMKPQLRSKDDQEALWKAISDGIVDTIGTDHAPHLMDEKKGNETYGVPGIETMLPLLLDAANKGRISLAKVQELCCENPARIFGIKNKGRIKQGYDADLVVVDMNKEKKVRNENLYTKCGWSPFDGKTLKGWPVMTIVRGNIVFGNGKILDNQGMEVEF